MPITSRPDRAIGMVWVWIGVGVTYFSSASARVMGSARPKSLKEVNVELSVARIGIVAAQGVSTIRARGGVRHPRVIGLSIEIKGQARNRLTGIRTRGSPRPERVDPHYMDHGCVAFKALPPKPAPSHGFTPMRGARMSAPLPQSRLPGRHAIKFLWIEAASVIPPEQTSEIQGSTTRRLTGLVSPPGAAGDNNNKR